MQQKSDRYQKAEAVLDKLMGGPDWRNAGGAQQQAGPEVANLADFGRLCVEHCYGDSWSRPGLDMKTRSLLTVAILGTLGIHDELKLHVKGALNVGNTKEEVVEVLIHLAAYAGVPRAVHASRMAREAFQEYDKGKKR